MTIKDNNNFSNNISDHIKILMWSFHFMEEKKLCFLIAKYLKSSFPEIASAFIKECEKQKKFPSSVFFDTPSFLQLESSESPNVPKNQLLQLLTFALNNFCEESNEKKIFKNNEFDKFIPLKRVLCHRCPPTHLEIDRTSRIMLSGSSD